MDQIEATHKLLIYITCTGLHHLEETNKFNTNPYVVVSSCLNHDKPDWQKVNQTETLQNNKNPDFKTPITLYYNFESEVYLKFDVINDEGKQKDNHILGCREITVGDIVGAKNGLLVLELFNKNQDQNKHRGNLMIRYEIQKESNEYILMNWSAKLTQKQDDKEQDEFDPFLRLSKQKEDKSFQFVGQTDHHENDLDPKWSEMDIKMNKLCNNDYKLPILAEIYDKEEIIEEDDEENIDFTSSAVVDKKKKKPKKKEFIGSCTFTMEELTKGKMVFELQNQNKVVGTLKLDNYKIIEWPDFIEYIRGGMQLNLILAIDFTSSNGEQSDEFSLHTIKEKGQMNQYQQAITDVGSILLSYDHDKSVPCYGFGAVPFIHQNQQQNIPQMTDLEISEKTSHCFALTGDEKNPDVKEIEGIMKIYKQNIKNLIFSGPTYFSQLIQQSLNKAKKLKAEQSETYLLLLILTDGGISYQDQQKTIDLIVEASYYPISIIIIGVGLNKFKEMKVLDGDKEGLKDSTGKKAQRDIVQFVKYKKYLNNPKSLAKHVLGEIPEQVRKYFRLKNIKPMAAPDTADLLMKKKSVIISEEETVTTTSSNTCEEHIKIIKHLTEENEKLRSQLATCIKTNNQLVQILNQETTQIDNFLKENPVQSFNVSATQVVQTQTIVTKTVVTQSSSSQVIQK